ncbi:DoxX family protein [Patescibacteria group bacterium]|nr:DoxX family protein [Patescibacteria group bacterium]
MLGVTILRITAGILFVYFGWLKLTKDKESKITFFKTIGFKPAFFWLWFVALTEIITGILIAVGFLAQTALIIASIIMFISIVIKIMKPSALPNTTDFYILFFVVFFSLIFIEEGWSIFSLLS